MIGLWSGFSLNKVLRQARTVQLHGQSSGCQMKRSDHRDPSLSLVLLIFRTRWHNWQRFWLWINYAVRLGGWKRERSAYKIAWKRSMKDVKPDPRWQGQCSSVVYTWREREPYLLASHQIAFKLAVPTWQHLQGSERKGSPDLSPRAPLCLTTGLSGDREWQTRTERGATSQRAQSFSPPAKRHSFSEYQQIVWIYLGLCQRKCASFTKATWVYFH